MVDIAESSGTSTDDCHWCLESCSTRIDGDPLSRHRQFASALGLIGFAMLFFSVYAIIRYV
eukprot:8912408-Pyramimonas_sp.AAC.1